mgnify:CR=1 FL=1
MPVGLIQTAQGGSSIERWNPKDGDLYGNMMNKIRETKGRYAGSPVVSGCEDTRPEQAEAYGEHFWELAEACALPWVMKSPSSLCS